jgi:hypothetical protein
VRPRSAERTKRVIGSIFRVAAALEISQPIPQTADDETKMRVVKTFEIDRMG